MKRAARPKISVKKKADLKQVKGKVVAPKVLR